MHEIDGAGHVGNQFSGGTPGVTEATVLTPDWCNAVQNELVNAIEGMGGTLSKPDNTQLITQLNAWFGRLGAANTWAGVQTLQARLESTAVPSTRELLWRMALGSDKYARFYSVSDASLEITLNAAWNSGTSEWDPDVEASASTLFQIDATGFRAAVVTGGTGSFADGSWVSILLATGMSITASSGLTVPGDTFLDGEFHASGDVMDFNGAAAPPLFYRNATRGSLTVNPTAGDPSAPDNGDIWYNSTTNELKVRINGTNRVINVT